jgi:hypothetical protein
LTLSLSLSSIYWDLLRDLNAYKKTSENIIQFEFGFLIGNKGSMGNMKCTRPKIILVPYPAQGHVTPMLKLAAAFNNRGFDTIMITPEYIHHQIVSYIEPKDQILCMPIPDGLDKDTPRDFFAIEMAMEKNMPVHLEGMVHKLDEDGEVVCVVVDLLASWAIEVANRCRVPVAGFWPAMLATYQMIAAIPDMVRTGLISDTG